MNVCETTTGRLRQHCLARRIVGNEGYGVIEALHIVFAKLPPRGESRGYIRGVGGHTAPMMRSPDHVRLFNWFERVRVGSMEERVAVSDRNGVRYQFWPDGSAYVRSDIGGPARPFDPAKGHWNADYVVRREDEIARARRNRGRDA